MSARRILGVVMMICGAALLITLLIILNRQDSFRLWFAVAFGIPGVLIAGLGGCFLFIEGEILSEKRGPDDDPGS
jgi:hypothetical protein